MFKKIILEIRNWIQADTKFSSIYEVIVKKIAHPLSRCRGASLVLAYDAYIPYRIRELFLYNDVIRTSLRRHSDIVSE